MSTRFRRGLFAPVAIAMLACALAACGATPVTTSNTSGGTISTDGWQHYTGAHFTLAYPSDWHQKSVPLTTNGAATDGNTYVFFSPDGTQELAVAELDGLTSSALQHVCGTYSSKATIAGLPMLYYLAGSGVRNYTFVSTNNIGYTLISEGPAKQPSNQGLYDAIMNTFQPDARDAACK